MKYPRVLGRAILFTSMLLMSSINCMADAIPVILSPGPGIPKDLVGKQGFFILREDLETCVLSMESVRLFEQVTIPKLEDRISHDSAILTITIVAGVLTAIGTFFAGWFIHG